MKKLLKKEKLKTVDCVKCNFTFQTTTDEDTCYDCEQGFNDWKNEDKSESA